MLKYYSLTLATNQEVIAAYSTRLGGVSSGAYASLNLGLHVGDDPERVRLNRIRFWQNLGIAANQVIAAEQVHGTKVVRVGLKELGRGSLDYATSISQTDALITNQPGIALTAYFADCASIYIFDPEHAAIGLGHAGWRGTVAGLAQKLLVAMQAEFNSSPSKCRVALGPCIGACCYEVGTEVVAAINAAGDPALRIALSPHPSGKWHFDLKRANRGQLIALGVRPEAISELAYCTACDTAFFSHRRDGAPTGRMGAVLMLKEK